MGTPDVVVSRDLAPPVPDTALTAARSERGPRLAARKVIQTYDADEWEVFIEEWAISLEPTYAQVRRFGGPGDRGVDVAGFMSDRGFEGEWDCFQGKHYDKTLKPSHAWPEMLKTFLLPVKYPRYKLPRRYHFIAPRGLATSLAHLVSTPTELQREFIAQVEKPTAKPFKDLDEASRGSVLELARITDFGMFGTVEVLQLIKQHGTTGYAAARFGGGLRERPRPPLPPRELRADEMGYVRKLVDAYQERYLTTDSVEAVEGHKKAGAHFRRQRESFFRAEALRSFARDSVPRNTFEGLQDEIFDAVVETVEGEHADGLERLQKTLELAVTAQLSANALIHVTEPADRRGICHQLANDDRLTWVVAT
ncbi:ABC-three component system protein [Cellulomonas sp. RIT-PI-Y]|uniref:ABC-three component system protein n=1 Tax=Cellulomonas sp. RIT-PI-Y TaxID=3035297 RepID=UPI0021D97304|nr:ABC-three component system protein [Cellulomonas sp. RIT-PI-Y]